MIVDVFIIRNGMRDFLVIDPDTGNWDWSKNLEDATIYKTADEANVVKLQKKLGDDAWVYQMPYSITQSRRKRKTVKPKRKICKCKK
jgi:hypothetical protein